MAISGLDLPIDIPWRRLTASPDMIDRTFADRRFPVRQTSSIALFYYQPELDDREDSETRVTYLKVVCTITGLNLDAGKASDELFLGLEEGEERGNVEIYLKLADLIRNVYPCYGAILEMAVFPGIGERVDDLDRYPYVSAFEPKQRQVFEAVSETGEMASTSGSGISVTKGGNTTGSTEDLSVRSGSSFQHSGQGGGSAGGGGGSAGWSVTGQWGSVGQSGTQNVNMITTDGSREKRESLSHTTQLAQLYTLLESYHLGTNRALFMLFPRPHIIAPLVAGPRAIEGVQEFFFVVEQPRDSKGLCVDTRLETQHVLSRTRTQTTGETKYEKDSVVQPIDETAYDAKIKTYTVSVPGGFVVDRSNGNGYSSRVDVGLTDRANVTRADVQDTSVTFSVQYSPLFLGSARFVGDLEVFYVSAQATESPVISTVEDATVVLTARTLGGCLRDRDGKWHKAKPNPVELLEPAISVTFERPVGQEYLSQMPVPGRSTEVDGPHAQTFRMEHANRFGDYLRRAAIASLSSSDRYPLGQHSVAETDFVCRLAASDTAGQGYAREAYERPARFPDEVLEGLSEADRSQVDRLRVADLLSFPTSLLATRLGLSTKTISEIKLMNVGLRVAVNPRLGPASGVEVEVPNVIGFTIGEARRALAAVRLSAYRPETVDGIAPAGTVLAQDPAAGSRVRAGDEVGLRLSSGASVRIPDVVGMGLAAAACALRDAGLRREPGVEPAEGDGRTGEVLGVEPPSRSYVTPHAEVILYVASLGGGSSPSAA